LALRHFSATIQSSSPRQDPRWTNGGHGGPHHNHRGSDPSGSKH
jgi:hypothetical protein